MSKGTSIKDALANWEKAKEKKAVESEEIVLSGVMPPIEKMDARYAVWNRDGQTIPHSAEFRIPFSAFRGKFAERKMKFKSRGIPRNFMNGKLNDFSEFPQQQIG